MAFDRQKCLGWCREQGLELGCVIEHSAETDSTNDDALGLAKRGAPHGTVVVADAQRQGRGRRGRSWNSAAGAGLWFSVLIRPSWEPALLSVLPLVIGLGVREVVARHLESPPLVKWPNDVLVGDRKLCGILAETQSRGGEVQAVVVGVGINLDSGHLPEDLARSATSMTALGASGIVRECLLVELLAVFERRLRRLQQEGFAPQLEELASVDALLGRRVRVDNFEGTAAGVSESGALLLDVGGKRHALLAGSVEFVRD